MLSSCIHTLHLQQIPNSANLYAQSKIPLGVIVQPMALDDLAPVSTTDSTMHTYGFAVCRCNDTVQYAATVVALEACIVTQSIVFVLRTCWCSHRITNKPSL
jgi:hypothetical protein